MRNALAVFLLLAVAAPPVAVAQGGCDDFHASPSGGLDVGADAGNAVMHVSGPEGCRYALAVRADAPWLSLGQDAATIRGGSAAVGVYWETNREWARSGTVEVVPEAGGPMWPFIVRQAAPTNACVDNVAPATLTFTAEGGSATVMVYATAGCQWTASVPAASWVRTIYGTHDGPTNVPVSVDPNDGAPRSATWLVAGRTVTIEQESITGERPGSGRTGTGNPVEDAAADWVGANEEPGPEVALVALAVLGAAVLRRRRPG